MEFQSLELFEDPHRNWRSAYHQQQHHLGLQLRKERAQGERRTEYFDDRFVRVCDMSDFDITSCCMEVARKTSERAIIEHENSLQFEEQRAQDKRRTAEPE